MIAAIALRIATRRQRRRFIRASYARPSPGLASAFRWASFIIGNAPSVATDVPSVRADDAPAVAEKAPATADDAPAVTAIRSTVRGIPAGFEVRFGNAPRGGASVSVMQFAATNAGDAEAAALGNGGGSAAGLSGSTVNGRSVSKTLPTGNDSANRV